MSLDISCNSMPLIGQPFPTRGGTLAAVIRDRGVNICLVVSPIAMAFTVNQPYDPGHHDIGSANSISDGFANTACLVSSGVDCPAAIAASMPADGFHDWYLPSLTELMAIRINLPELLRETEIYLTSTQNDAFDVWALSGKSAIPRLVDKAHACLVVPVRRYALA